MVSLFPDALAAPGYLILGVPGVQIPQGLPGGRAAPPLPGRGWGGRSSPWRSWIFQHKPRPRPRPLLMVPPLLAPKYPLLGLRPAFCRSLSPQRKCRKMCQTWIAGFGVQRAGSSPDPRLSNPYSIWITRLSEVNPAPDSVQHLDLATPSLGPTALPIHSRPRLCLKASHFPRFFPHPVAARWSSQVLCKVSSSNPNIPLRNLRLVDTGVLLH